MILNKQNDMREEKYNCDFLISIGESCRPAGNLYYEGLRFFSSPLDWMMDYSLDTALHLFRTGFIDFFEQYELDVDNPISDTGNLKVHDTKNIITSIHDFPKEEPLDSSYPEFKEKMHRRVKRLESKLMDAKSIVLLSGRNDSVEELTDFLMSFSSIYSHLTIRLVNIRDTKDMPYDTFEERIILKDNNLSYIEYAVNDSGKGLQWRGNKDMWSVILSKYSVPV